MFKSASPPPVMQAPPPPTPDDPAVVKATDAAMVANAKRRGMAANMISAHTGLDDNSNKITASKYLMGS